MSLPMYDATVPVFTAMLENLKALFAKAEAEKGAEAAALLTLTLAPDMFALPRQVQIATDHARGAAARLAGIERPSFEDDETSFADLVARIDRTIVFLATLKPESFAGAEERTIAIKVRGNDLRFRGADYLYRFALPNFYFHVTIAYAILRHGGVGIGKLDFLGDLPTLS